MMGFGFLHHLRNKHFHVLRKGCNRLAEFAVPLAQLIVKLVGDCVEEESACSEGRNVVPESYNITTPRPAQFLQCQAISSKGSLFTARGCPLTTPLFAKNTSCWTTSGLCRDTVHLCRVVQLCGLEKRTPKWMTDSPPSDHARMRHLCSATQ